MVAEADSVAETVASSRLSLLPLRLRRKLGLASGLAASELRRKTGRWKVDCQGWELF